MKILYSTIPRPIETLIHQFNKIDEYQPQEHQSPNLLNNEDCIGKANLLTTRQLMWLNIQEQSLSQTSLSQTIK